MRSTGPDSYFEITTCVFCIDMNLVTAAGWRYVGGETGWELVQHAADFRNGKWVHADRFDHNLPKPSVASIEQAKMQNQDLYSGG